MALPLDVWSRSGHDFCLATVSLLASRWYAWFSVVLGDVLIISVAIPSSVLTPKE